MNMRKNPLGAAILGALILCNIGLSTASAPPFSLVLPQSAAFAVLGHSCGGIQEKVYATGFDPASGHPTGDVYIQTRCGGSGRGGGYHTTTYSAWVAATWDFAGNLVAYSRLSTAPAVSGTLSVTDAYGDTLTNVNGVAYLSVPTPAAPTGVSAAQVGDQAAVSWTPVGANPGAVASSTLTATPNNASPVLTATVTGNAASGLIGPLQPQTTYAITVVTTTTGGSGPASAPVSLTTASASVAPSAPTGVTARWQTQDPTGATDALIATWNSAAPGNSPVDQYQVTINGSDGGGTVTQTVSGTTLTAHFAVDYTPNWTVTVRAHNAAGWGPWSAPITLGGL